MTTETTVYAKGGSAVRPGVAGARRAGRERGGFAWVDLHEPGAAEVAVAAAEVGLDEQLEEEVLRPGRRPGLEVWGDIVLLTLRPARSVVAGAAAASADVLAVVGEDYVVTARWGGGTSVADARRRLEGSPELGRWGPAAVLVALVEEVVGGYGPVVDELETAVEATEAEVFEGTGDPSRRIYGHSRTAAALLRATRPVAEALAEALAELRAGGAAAAGTIDPADEEARRYARQVRERVLRVTERLEDLQERLAALLQVNLTLVAVRENDRRQDATQRISAWAAILAVPALLTGLYGMDFAERPELSWTWGFPLALGVIALAMGVLFGWFKRLGWL